MTNPIFDIVFHQAPEGWVEIGTKTDRRFVRIHELTSLMLSGMDVASELWYGPALRGVQSSEKTGVYASRVLWADSPSVPDGVPLAQARKVAKALLQPPVLPPSIVVWSGWGYHYYWVLSEWITDLELLENANKVQAEGIGGDNCWNMNRMLRLPGTFNNKRTEPSLCEILEANPYTYNIADAMAVGSLKKAVTHRIRTGDERNYHSRSERDFGVLQELAALNITEQTIKNIFEWHRIGNKLKDEEAKGNAERYFTRSLKKAKASVSKTVEPLTAEELGQRDDGYYAVSGRKVRRLSTFTLDPTLLLVGDKQDALVCDVHAGGYVWKDVTFTRTAFNGRNQLDKELPLASWQFLGRDDDARALLPYLLSRLESRGLPKVRATSTLGLHRQGEHWWFVGDASTLGQSGARVKDSAPLVYLATGRESPKLAFADQGDPDITVRIGSLLPRLNVDRTIWPTIGWYFATPFKPALEQAGVRFPILNLFGTRGSGKTTTLLRVFLPLLAQREPKTYDAGTTKFVALSLLGSSNAVPIAFSEFRSATVGPFLRFVLLAYDTGHDPRGRPDQTTLDYPLSAPFSIDGEDAIDDPAARERIIAVDFHPDNVARGTVAWDTHQTLQMLKESFPAFGTGYLQLCLQTLDSSLLVKKLNLCREQLSSALPASLPDRIQNNLCVCWLGITMFCEYTKQTLPDPTVLLGALDNVYSSGLGRTKTMADEFVSDLINYLANKAQNMSWKVDGNIAWFQLAPSFSWWSAHRQRTHQAVLGLDAIRAQLAEAHYVTGPTEIEGRQMYGVDLLAAYTAGLDIPKEIDTNTYTFPNQVRR